MLKTLWYVGFFLSNLFRLKFRVFWKYINDKNYRKDMGKIIGYLAQGKPVVYDSWIPLYQIHLSHDIIYPEWVNKIVAEIPANELRRSTWESKNRITVYKLEAGKYIVLNGNHRLQAMMKLYDPQAYLVVDEITFPNKSRSYLAYDRVG